MLPSPNIRCEPFMTPWHCSKEMQQELYDAEIERAKVGSKTLAGQLDHCTAVPFRPLCVNWRNCGRGWVLVQPNVLRESLREQSTSLLFKPFPIDRMWVNCVRKEKERFSGRK